ncbi:MAG TPA: iron-sulfur cluster insertion protein ErpA [Aestuariivirgaceae bacterium]|jgi:iron-sulfur cluster assembly accessory protein
MTSPITVTDRAADRIKQILAAEPGKMHLRVSVSGGGCSGFQYGFALDDARNDDDIAVEKNGAMVVVDSVSLAYMQGAEIDFVDDLIGASFKVRNPQATASCGCGTSFSI